MLEINRDYPNIEISANFVCGGQLPPGHLPSLVSLTREKLDRYWEIGSPSRVSLMVTTNLPFEQWTEILGSERLTGALLDRLTHRVHILEANGESYRLREAKKRIKRSSPRKTKET